MRSNLACGLDTAKGLAVAWQIPLVGVHHMQAHALTPRLASAIQSPQNKDSTEQGTTPQFPFLSLLVSGGHTLLLHSKSLTSHRTLATTTDTAIGEALDKIARDILPASMLEGRKDTMYARLLSDWAFPTIDSMNPYNPPRRRGEEINKPVNKYGWAMQNPYAETKDLKFSFSGLASRVNKLVNRANYTMSDDERVLLARTALMTAFEHLASRTVIALEHLRTYNTDIKTLVLSGGVAANSYLRLIMRRFLDVRGFGHVDLVFPPVELCTDNAAMIAWTGIEMWEEGWASELSVQPIRKWPMDEVEVVEWEQGTGILGVGGWKARKSSMNESI